VLELDGAGRGSSMPGACLRVARRRVKNNKRVREQAVRQAGVYTRTRNVRGGLFTPAAIPLNLSAEPCLRVRQARYDPGTLLNAASCCGVQGHAV